jgi:probable phosphoglycerate mutase
VSEPTRIIAIRHGETDWNAAARIQGHTDIALNAAGRWQASQLSRGLADERLDAVYASDLLRAYETALAFAGPKGVEVVREPGLRERQFGSFEGFSFEEIERRWPDDARRWRQRDEDFGPGGGETLRDFYARIVATTERLALRHAGQNIVLVAHGGVLDCLYRAATRLALNAPRTWEVGNASINRLLHSPEGLTLVGWSDEGHLHGGMPAA